MILQTLLKAHNAFLNHLAKFYGLPFFAIVGHGKEANVEVKHGVRGTYGGM